MSWLTPSKSWSESRYLQSILCHILVLGILCGRMRCQFRCAIVEMRIGIDVGGTNTDGVLMQGREVLAWAKKATSADVTSGIKDVLQSLLGTDVQPADIGAVMIGTTHFTNAVIQRRDLVPTGVVRLSLPAGEAVPPLYNWPRDLQAVVGNHRYLAHGGHEFDGREISALDPDELAQIADELTAAGVNALAVVGVFAPVTPEHEQRTAEIFRARNSSLDIALSHEIGRLSLLERENATALNASLAPLARRTMRGFRNALAEMDIRAELYVTQNDGTLMSADFAEQYPVLTFSSGPTNSMRGAAFLTGLSDAMVIDIGGTTTDVGVLSGGFPREASFAVDIGGVRTNFRMPDLISIGLGGGSLVREDGRRIGPESVGYQIRERSLAFGGDELTATDIAVASGWVKLGDPGRVANLPEETRSQAQTSIHDLIAQAVDQLRTSSDPVPVIVVGGGSILVHDDLDGASEVHKPEHFLVANAIGAAIAQVSGEVDQIFSLETMSRQAAIGAAKDQARARAIQAGALEDTIEVVELEEIPLPYLPSSATRIRVKMVGQL